MARLPTRFLRVAAVALMVAVAVAGCGRAASQKAKHLQKGQEFLAAGNLEKARVEFRNALQIAPNDSEARYENGLVAERMRNIREAAQFYQGAIDSDPDNFKARASLGRFYILSGAPDKAMETITPSLGKHPDDAGLLTVRAAARVQFKDPAGALADAERAVSLEPANEDAVAVLAGVYKSQNQMEKSRTLLESTIKAQPQTVDLRLALAQLYVAMGLDAEVETIFVDLVRLHPTEKANRIRLAQYYARLNRVDDAEKVLRDGVKDLPDEREMKTTLVQFLAERRSREAAEAELQQLIAASPKDFDLKFALAKFYEQGKDTAKAEGVLRDVISAAGLDGPGLAARDALATMRVQQNDLPAAEKLVGEVLAKSPRDNDALILRGNIALGKKDPKTAIADLRSVLRDQPNAVGVMRSLARAHLANGEPALAEETIRRAVEANPTDIGARTDLTELLVQLGKADQAKPVADELVKQQPNNVTGIDLQFRIAMAMKDYGAAQTAAEALVTVQPKQGLGYYYLAGIADTKGQVDDAVRLYFKALEVSPDAFEPLLGLTNMLVNAKRGSEALKYLDAALARDPKLSRVWNLKGEVLVATQHIPDSIAAFKTAAELAPAWYVPYGHLADAYAYQKDTAQATASLIAAIPKVENKVALESQLALMYERAGKVEDAINVYEESLRRTPDSDIAANNLAMVLVTYKKDQASLDRAKALSTKFANSQSAAFLDTYGWVLYKRGEGVPAVAALQSSLAKAPGSPTLLYHLGMAQALTGKADAARDSLSQALKGGSNFFGADEAKATLDKLGSAPTIAAPPKG